MKINISQSSIGAAKCIFNKNESLVVESGSMVSIRGPFSMEAGTQNGIVSAFQRLMFAKESFFQTSFKAEEDDCELKLSHGMPGQMKIINMDKQCFLLKSGAFVASEESISTDTKWTGSKTLFGSDGVMTLQATGSGVLLIGGYGDVEELVLEENEHMVVSSGHILAWEDTVSFNPTILKSLKNALFSGTNVVINLKGPGTIYIQSRDPRRIAEWLPSKLGKQV